MAYTKAKAKQVTYKNDGAGSVIRDLHDKLNEFVSVKDFGAVGDGVTDDTAAIQAANDAGAAVYFPAGTYCATSLTKTANWSMADGALLKFIGAADSKNFVNCTGSNLRSNLNVSGNESYVQRLVNIDGNNNVFSRIVVQDMVSPNVLNPHVALRIGGNGNIVSEAIGFDLVNTGNANSSCPQFITFATDSDKNQVLKIAGKNVRNAFLAYSVNENFVGEISVPDAMDNGIYCSKAGGRTIINSLLYGGTDEAAVFIDGANASVGTIIVSNAANTVVRVNGCGVVDIGKIQILDNGVDRVFRQTGDVTAVSNTLRIGHIQGEFTGGSLFQLTDGVVQNLVIGSMDVTFVFDASVMTGSKFSWARANIAEGVQFGKCNITIVDKNNVLTNSDIFEMRLRNPLLRPSYIDSWNVWIVNSDRVTQSIAQARVNSIGDALLTVRSGHVQANAGRGYLREITQSIPGDRLTANAAPTVGSWKQGDVVWQAFPVAGESLGWVCTTAGTPGTWKNMSEVKP